MAICAYAHKCLLTQVNTPAAGLDKVGVSNATRRTP